MSRETQWMWVRFVVALVVLIVVIFPVYWLFIKAFKTPEEIFAFPPVWIPGSFYLDNFRAMARTDDLIPVWNSLVITSVSTAVSMFLGTICAYSMARFRTGGDNLAIWILSQRMLPPVAIAFPMFLAFAFLQWVDTFQGMIVVYTAFNLPFVIWMMRGYIQDVPIELEESALVDGCTRWQTLIKVVFPMVRTGLFATAVFTFIFAWNEFGFALVLTREKVLTFPVHVSHYFGALSTYWGKVGVISIIGTLPVFFAVAFLQRYLVRGMSMGALKG